MFHHAEDPLDLKDVSEDNPDRVKTLAALLESEMARILEGALEEGGSTENLSDEELQRRFPSRFQKLHLQLQRYILSF